MSNTIKMISAAIALGAALSAQAQNAEDTAGAFDLNAQSTADRAAVVQGARDAVAHYQFKDDTVGAPELQRSTASSVDRAQVKAGAEHAIKAGTLSSES